MFKIVIIDGGTLNPGDLSWENFREPGEVDIYENSEPSEVSGRVTEADAIIVNKVQLRSPLLESLPQLKYIGVSATGYDCVDLPTARDRGITVTNVPIYGTQSVAQMTFALLLELCHRVGHHDQAVKSGKWSLASNFCFWDYPQIELDHLTMGIIGLGRIGTAVARIADAFGMETIAYSRHPGSIKHDYIKLTDLVTVFRRADVLSLHCPLTSETKGLVNEQRLRLMKPTSFLINTSRGALIVEEDLKLALEKGIISGAAVDVLSKEPPPESHVLLSASNCIITPHISWATRAARSRLIETTLANLRAYVHGHQQNRVI